jgi:hypothetical protein
VPMSGGDVTPPMLRELPPATPWHFGGPDASPALPVAPVAPRAGRVPKNCACAQRGTASAPRPDVIVSPPPATPAACVC